MGNYLVYVKHIDWMDKDNPEAQVLFELKGVYLWAFCHPCDLCEGEIAEVEFSFIQMEGEELNDLFWVGNKEQKKQIVPLESDTCQYICYGQLISIHPVIVDCGIIKFSFGDWLNDESVIGCYVYFVISRLDIQRVR